MKFQTLISVLALSAVPMFASSAAQASAIYLNPLAPPGTQTLAAGSLSANWTGVSSYTDANGTGSVEVGEAVVDSVVRHYSEAGVTVLNNYGDIGLIPNFSVGQSGYGSTWSLYFNYSVTGTVIFSDGNDILANYTSGFIDIFYDDYVGRTAGNAGRDITTDARVMRVNVTGSTGTFLNSVINGAVESVSNEVFFFADGARDFADVLGAGFAIDTRVDSNLDVNGVPTGPAGGTLTRSSTLDGSVRFTDVTEVPEPSMLALFGFGMLGLGIVRRRKKAA